MPRKNKELAKVPFEDEIRKLVWEMNLNKAPGPDSFSGSFYGLYWSTVKPEVVDTVKEFFRKRKFVKEINMTFICLNSKSESPVEFNKLCLISLCNFNYNVTAELLANRIKPQLDNIISLF